MKTLKILKIKFNKFLAYLARNLLGEDYYYSKNMNGEYCWWMLTSYGTFLRLKMRK